MTRVFSRRCEKCAHVCRYFFFNLDTRLAVGRHTSTRRRTHADSSFERFRAKRNQTNDIVTIIGMTGRHASSLALIALVALSSQGMITPAHGKIVSAKKYVETHSREEFRDVLAERRSKAHADGSRRDASRRLTNIGEYCETDAHCGNGAICEEEGSWTNGNGQRQSWGYCTKDCWKHDECDGGSYCSIQEGYSCRSCAAFATFDSVDGTNPCTACMAHSDCDQGEYCTRSYYWDDNTYQSFEKQICSGCSGCWSWNTFDYGSCPGSGSGEQCDTGNANAYDNTNWENDFEQGSLRELPAECWLDAAHAQYDDLYVGDCGAFGEETELWCEGFCIADSWFDCCDPKAGAIAALTMGCFFAFVGALFSAAWIFKCWCFKKQNAMMLQAMANQQQQRMMAANQMQSPVIVQMQPAHT
jgi:hypothetical protein